MAHRWIPATSAMPIARPLPDGRLGSEEMLIRFVNGRSVVAAHYVDSEACHIGAACSWQADGMWFFPHLVTHWMPVPRLGPDEEPQ